MQIPEKVTGRAGAAAALTDEQVVERVLGGDADLFELLMRRHNGRVYRTVRSVLRDESEVEDVMQQAYVRAWLNLRQFKGTSRFSTWLTRIALNEALGRARARRTARLVVVGDVGASVDEDVMAVQPASPEDRAEARELSALLERAVDALPDLYRTVYMLRNVEDLDVAETAEALEVSEDVVKTRLHRARALLRDALFEHVTSGGAEAFPFHAPRCDRVVGGVLRIIADMSPQRL